MGGRGLREEEEEKGGEGGRRKEDEEERRRKRRGGGGRKEEEEEKGGGGVVPGLAHVCSRRRHQTQRQGSGWRQDGVRIGRTGPVTEVRLREAPRPRFPDPTHRISGSRHPAGRKTEPGSLKDTEVVGSTHGRSQGLYSGTE